MCGSAWDWVRRFSWIPCGVLVGTRYEVGSCWLYRWVLRKNGISKFEWPSRLCFYDDHWGYQLVTNFGLRDGSFLGCWWFIVEHLFGQYDSTVVNSSECSWLRLHHLSLPSILHRFHPYIVAVNVVGYHLVSVSAAGYMCKISSLICVHGFIGILYLDVYVFLFG